MTDKTAQTEDWIQSRLSLALGLCATERALKANKPSRERDAEMALYYVRIGMLVRLEKASNIAFSQGLLLGRTYEVTHLSVSQLQIKVRGNPSWLDSGLFVPV